MSIYENLINDLVTQINSKLGSGSFMIRRFPDTGKDQDNLPVARLRVAKLYVDFVEQKFNEEMAIGQSGQSTDLDFAIQIEGKTLYDESIPGGTFKGIYTRLEEVARVVKGYKPASGYGSSFSILKIYLKDQNAEQKNWIYEIQIRLTDYPFLPVEDEYEFEETGTKLKKVTVASEYDSPDIVTNLEENIDIDGEKLVE